MKYLLYILIALTVFWLYTKPSKNRIRYLPVKNVNMKDDQKKYVLSELNRFREWLKHEGIYTETMELELLIDKIKEESLGESDVIMINNTLQKAHSIRMIVG